MIISVHCAACDKTAYLSIITARRQAHDHGNRNYCLTCEPAPKETR